MNSYSLNISRNTSTPDSPVYEHWVRVEFGPCDYEQAMAKAKVMADALGNAHAYQCSLVCTTLITSVDMPIS